MVGRRLASLALLLATSCASFEAGGPDGSSGGASGSGSSGGASSGGAGDGGSSGGASGGASSGGGSSSGGAGGVEVLASGLLGPRSLAVAGGSVYWASVEPVSGGSASQLHRCDVAGCAGASARLLDEPAFHVTAGAASVYWNSGSALRGCAEGATCAPQTVRDGLLNAGLLRQHGGSLYFTAGGVGAVALSTCRPESCATATPLWSGSAVGVLAFSGDDVYFTVGSGFTDLMRLRGGNLSALGALPGLPTSLAVHGTQVYVVTRNQLFRCDASVACTLVPFARRETRVFKVVTQGDAVYYSVFASGGSQGGLYRCGLQECESPETVVGGGNPADFVIDEGFLYFADNGDGTSADGSLRRLRL